MQFKGIRDIVHIRADTKSRLMGSMQKADGEQTSDRKEIADVFAQFYETLYKDVHRGSPPCKNSPAVPEVTPQEVQC